MFQVWVGTLNIMERDREREKAGEKKIKKKKKEMEQRFCSGTTQ